MAATIAAVMRDRIQPHVAPSDSVVDFGCGGGELLAELDAVTKVGIDTNEPARAAAAARGIRAVAGSAELPRGTFDVAIAHHSLEHALDPYRELESLRELLRPGGRLIVWVPIDDWRVQRDSEMADLNNHLYTWTPLLLRNILTEARFRVVECEVVTRAWPPRHMATLHRALPAPLFEALCLALAVILRRRQLVAVAVTG